jgi:hypothetical protein
VAAELGLADLIADGPKSSDELAAMTGAHPQALSVLLRSLVETEVLAEDEQGCFPLTPLGTSLRSGRPDLFRERAVLAREMEYRAWGQLLDTVRTQHLRPWVPWWSRAGLTIGPRWSSATSLPRQACV